MTEYGILIQLTLIVFILNNISNKLDKNTKDEN